MPYIVLHVRHAIFHIMPYHADMGTRNLHPPIPDIFDVLSHVFPVYSSSSVVPLMNRPKIAKPHAKWISRVTLLLYVDDATRVLCWESQTGNRDMTTEVRRQMPLFAVQLS